MILEYGLKHITERYFCILTKVFIYDIIHPMLKLWKSFRGGENMLKELLGTTVTVYVDRALGTRHPRFTDMIYPVNYGYVKDVIGGDGEEQDAYILRAEHIQ